MVKERPDNQKNFDNDGYKQRAACICVKNENESEVLLVSSSRNKNCWIIPGGSIERNENPEDAAEREVYEEAGVQGRLGRLLGKFEVFENNRKKHRTNVYLLIVDKELEEWEEHKNLGRIRKWFNLEEAKIELEKHKPLQGTYINFLKGYGNISYRKQDIITYPNINQQNETTTENHNHDNSASLTLASSIVNAESDGIDLNEVKLLNFSLSSSLIHSTTSSTKSPLDLSNDSIQSSSNLLTAVESNCNKNNNKDNLMSYKNPAPV